MKVIIRDYFEDFYRLFEAVRDFNGSNLLDFKTLKSNIELRIEKSKRYQILDVESIDRKLYDSDIIEDVKTDRLFLLSIIYKIIVDNLYSLHFTRVDRENYYEQRLWIILSHLQFEDYVFIRDYNNQFKEDTLFSGFKLSYLRYDAGVFQSIKEEYLKFKSGLPKEDIPFKKDEYDLIVNTLSAVLDQYHDFIKRNYPSMASLFPYFNKDVRLYILDAPSGGKYTSKLIAYENANIPKLHVHDKILTLSNRLGNLEEIDKEVSESLLSVFDFDLEYIINIFSKERCYFSALQIFYKVSDAGQIFLLFLYLLQLNKIKVKHHDVEKLTIVLETKKEEQNILCCFAKDLSTTKFRGLEKIYDSFIFLTRPDDTTTNLLGKEKIGYIHSYVDQQFHMEAINYYIKDKLDKVVTDKTISNGRKLIDNLTLIEKGKNDWNKYENLCIEIFGYLFSDSFRHLSFEKQSNTEHNIHRRDLLVNNIPRKSNTFWSDIKNLYGSNAIVCEFKNYSEELNADTLFNTTKYINTNNRLILIFSRMGCDKSARELQIKLLRERKVLVLVLDDTDIINMLKEKDLGIDILYRLENLKFEIEKKL